MYADTPPPAAQLTWFSIKYSKSEEEVDGTGENRMGREEERAVVLKNRQRKGWILGQVELQRQYTLISSCLNVNVPALSAASGIINTGIYR